MYGYIQQETVFYVDFFIQWCNCMGQRTTIFSRSSIVTVFFCIGILFIVLLKTKYAIENLCLSFFFFFNLFLHMHDRA